MGSGGGARAGIAGSRTIHVDLLGPPRLRVDGRAVEVSARKQRALLAVLALRPGAIVSAPEIIGALWGEQPPLSASKTLQTYVWRLRKLLGDTAILTRAPGYGLVMPREDVDLHRFDDGVAAARQALATGEPSLAVDLFDDALALWRGDPLSDLGDTDLARAEITRLRELRFTALEERAGALLGTCDSSVLVPELEALVTEHPFRERLWCRLMVALYRSGRQRDALDAFRRARRVLIDQLGIEPGPELREIERAVLAQAPELGAGVAATVGASGSVTVVPPSPRDRGTVSPVPTTFFGREREVRALADVVASPGIVTLTGPGGVGKSRLAQELAAVTSHTWPAGAWLVELASVAEARAVPEAVAAQLELRVPTDRAAGDGVVEALRSRRCLIVLDNCEHVLDGARDIVMKITRSCPRITVLATSREPLSVAAERVWPVEPLAAPRPGDAGVEELRANSAVALLVDRAQAARPDFELTRGNAEAIVEICRRLDGLPLALELAAARLRSLGPGDLAGRLHERFRLLRRGLRSAPHRHQALQGVVDWSYRLLDEGERRLFEQLSVFAGTFDLDAVESLCSGSATDRAEVPDILGGLVDKSMVVAREAADGTARYLLLDTLRQFAADRLAERGEAVAMARRHARHFAALAAEAGAGVHTPDEVVWVARVDAAFDDLRSAHAWSMRHGDVDVALAVPADLLPFVERQGWGEVLTWAEAAIGLPGCQDHERYPDACAAAARKAGLSGDLRRAEELGRRSVELAVAGGKAPSQAALYAAALRSSVEGDEDALALHVRRRDLALSVDDHYGAGAASAYAAIVAGYHGDTDVALEMADEAVVLAERNGSPALLAGALYARGEVLQDVDPARATGHLEEALSLARSVRADFVADITLVSLASLHGRHGDPQRALELFIEVVGNWWRHGTWRQQWVTLRNVAELLGRLGLAAQAAVLLGAIDASPTAPGVYGAQASRLTELRNRLDAHLGHDGMRLASDHGAAMADDEVVTYVRSVMEDALSGRSVAGADP